MKMCKIIDAFAPETSKLDKVFAAASLYYNYSHGEKCFNLENGPDVHGLSGWNWQVCLFPWSHYQPFICFTSEVLLYEWFELLLIVKPKFTFSFNLNVGLYRDGDANDLFQREHVSTERVRLWRICNRLQEEIWSFTSSALDHYWVRWRSEICLSYFILISLLHFQTSKENKTTSKNSGDHEAISYGVIFLGLIIKS